MTTELNCKDVAAVLKSDFQSLWNCEQRGASLEIVTPYIYPDNSFVTLFVTKRGKNFVVSDGAQASEFFQSAKGDEPFYASLLSRSKLTHGITEMKHGDQTFFYKKTEDKKLVSSIAFDMVNFLMASSNAAYFATAEEDSLDKNSFRQRADTFIKHAIPRSSGRTVKFNQKIEQVKEATFSAVISSNSRLWLIIYLTGSNLTYFQLSVSNAIVNVEFTQQSSIKRNISAIVPLLNDEATGYQPNRLTQRLGKLSDLTHSPIIHWKRKADLVSAIS